MLGIDTNKKSIIAESYASEIRKALRRARTGKFNSSDRKTEARSSRIKREYDAVWK